MGQGVRGSAEAAETGAIQEAGRAVGKGERAVVSWSGGQGRAADRRARATVATKSRG